MNESQKVEELFNNLLESETYRFPVSGKVNKSPKQGVYIIYGTKNEVLHAGKTARAKGGLNQRLTNHLRNQSSFSNQYVLSKGIDLRQTGRFKFIEIENPRTRAFVEALTIGKLCPAHIGTGSK